MRPIEASCQATNCRHHACVESSDRSRQSFRGPSVNTENEAPAAGNELTQLKRMLCFTGCCLLDKYVVYNYRYLDIEESLLTYALSTKQSTDHTPMTNALRGMCLSHASHRITHQNSRDPADEHCTNNEREHKSQLVPRNQQESGGHQQLTNDQLIPQSKDMQPLPTTKIGAVLHS